jgi:thioredoxin-related protein
MRQLCALQNDWKMGRIVAVSAFLIVVFLAIGVVFWQQELKYQLPTPVPVQYQSVAMGASIDKTLLPKGSAYFLHFYNPDCPCSRFNARYVKSLIRQFGDSVSMYVVVPSQQDLSKAQKEFDGQNFIVDKNNNIANTCGVYSTPQAAIIDHEGKLFYRGNYNRSRYCTTKASNFAELSLVALLNKQPSPAFGLMATQAYGCEWNDPDKNDIELF